MDRRAFLKRILRVSALGSLIPAQSYGASLLKNYKTKEIPPKPHFPEALSFIDGEKSLCFYNQHTGETLKKCVFWVKNSYNSEAINQINHLFRDHRTHEVYPIDPNLLHLLHGITKKLESHQAIHLISGYRSSKTNEALRLAGQGVSEKSQHLKGKAADIFIPDRSLNQLCRAAKSLKGGGVGLYKRFIHVDTGRVRHWG